ncbi:hypothetical protein KBD75_00455 [Candidatus Woesebacteria bacterium]|nr:hypothetical protein [Candidatus Woesebacteria bacterium]
MKIKYPVVFFVFKRHATTWAFLDHIIDAGISTIYVFADGPRNDIDKIDTGLVRKEIERFQTRHPEITVIPKFSSVNLGLKKNIIRGVSAVFEHEEAVIILEDDCLPTLDFFKFTSEMLIKYADDKSVMSVNGTSTGGKFEYSYDFNLYPQCWGWATWRRAWRLYDPTLSHFTKAEWDNLAHKHNFSPLLKWYWGTMLTMVKDGWINTWDFQWSYAHFYHDGLSIAPSVNLIKNIGFDNVATNTKTKSKVSGMATNLLKWPLIHPKGVIENQSVTHKATYDFYLNPIAIGGLLRQYIYWKWSNYVNRH